MGWFKKKEKSPETSSQLPELPEKRFDQELPPLPSYPSNNHLGEESNQNMFKSAVSSSGEKRGVVEELPRDFSFPPTKKSEPSVESVSEIPEIPEKRTFEIEQTPDFPKQGEKAKKAPMQEQVKIETRVIKETEPVFVRIDLFHEARDDIEKAKSMIRDIEHTLRRLRENKQKEDEEIEQWMQEMEKVKARLANVDANIFSKV